MKHSYLIIAHSDFHILEKMIYLLDDKRNDLYVHIDLKVSDFNFEHYKKLPKYSNIYLFQKFDVRWGDFSMVECELFLLQEAVKKDYNYYHLLSGCDLPLKNNDYIDSFFEKNNGKEFIHFCSLKQIESSRNRINKYHFTKLLSSKNGIFGLCAHIIYKTTIFIQETLNINRKENISIPYGYGSQWFSITNEFAHFVIDNINYIYLHFNHTYCPDELFIQSLVMKSDYKNNLYLSSKNDDYRQNMRCIDWNRGNPYVFRKNDYQYLINSEFLFARKFNTNIDNDIIEIIYNDIKKQNAENFHLNLSPKGKAV